MAIGAIWRVERLDLQMYDRMRERLMQPAQEAGLRFHAAGEAEGGLRIIEVWESREGLERFMRESLQAASEEIMGPEAPPPMPPETFEVHYQGP
jgi:hypothetical protein